MSIQNTTQAEQEIRTALAQWSSALEAKDSDGIVAFFAEDGVLYDAISPYKTVGSRNVKAVWEGCFPYLPKKLKSSFRDLSITINGDLAVVFGLHRMEPIDEYSPCGDSWMRITLCMKRIDGKWKSFHDHVSTPFDPMTGKAMMITSPDNPAESSPFPDWSAQSAAQNQ